MASQTIEKYRGMLVVNKHRLDDELEIQADIQERISAEVATLNSRMLECKDDLAKIEARLSEEFRDSDAKLTVDGIKGKVLRHAERGRAWDRHQKAREDLEVAQGILDAWIKRGFSLKTLGELYTGQYFSVRSAGAPRERPVRATSESRPERAARLAEDSIREAAPDMLPRRRRRED